MAYDISNIDLHKLLPTALSTTTLSKSVALKDSNPINASSMQLSVKNDPTALILQSAMEKINAQFAPHIGDGALKKAIESGQDLSPKGTAESILSFATQLIGRAEADQADLPLEQQRSRAQLFQNIQTGVKAGFTQARDILEGMQALNGKIQTTVDDTYALVQQGLNKLELLLRV